jgi:hypothetical protein
MHSLSGVYDTTNVLKWKCGTDQHKLKCRVYYFLNVYKFLILLSMEVKGRDAVVLFQDEAEGIK